MKTKIYAEVPKEELYTCKVCSKTLNSKKGLSLHLRNVHDISIADYMGDFYVNGGRPKCLKCGENTNYNSKDQSFQVYCPDHLSETKKILGKVNGFGSNNNTNANWRKGLTKETSESIKKHSESIKGSNNHFFGRKHSKKTREKIKNAKSDKTTLSENTFEERKKKVSDRFIVLTAFEDFHGVHKPIEVECIKCKDTSQRSLWALERFSICKKCNPSSTEELELKKFLSDLEIDFLENSRMMIPPKEIDVTCLIPNKIIGIEYNGLYWHTENKRGKSYHLDKLISCIDNGIELIHVFSDDWKNKQNIIKSIIRNKLGMSLFRYNARSCEIKTMTKSEEKEHFNTTHISGFSPSKLAFGLFYKGKCVAGLSLREPLSKKYKGYIEICRFSSELFSNVRGGLSRLLKKVKKWAIGEGYHGVLTYADRNFGEGDGYLKVGFEKIGSTSPNYFYTNGKERFGRMTFKAQKGMTEREYAESMGVERIYGCGSNIFLLSLPILS